MQKLRSVLAKVLEVNESEISEKTSPADIPTWDSFNALLLVVELENAFQVKFTMDEVASVKNVADIIKSLERHGVILDAS